MLSGTMLVQHMRKTLPSIPIAGTNFARHQLWGPKVVVLMQIHVLVRPPPSPEHSAARPCLLLLTKVRKD